MGLPPTTLLKCKTAPTGGHPVKYGCPHRDAIGGGGIQAERSPARLVSKGDKSMESSHLFMAWVSGMLCCGAKCAVAGARAAMVAAVSCRARAGLAIHMRFNVDTLSIHLVLTPALSSL